MSGFNNNSEQKATTNNDEQKDAILKVNNTLRRTSPQLMWLEALAVARAGASAADAKMIDALINGAISKGLVSSISKAEREFVFDRSLYQRLKNNNSPIVRYLVYVWIDAIGTAAIVSSKYTNSLRAALDKDEPKHSRLSPLYSTLNTIASIMLKIALAAFAVAVTATMLAMIPLMILAAVVAGGAYVFGYSNISKAIMSLIRTAPVNIYANIYAAFRSKVRWNALYPITVAIPGFILKVGFIAVAVALIPVMAVGAVVTYAAGFNNAYEKFMSYIAAGLGLIATIPLSNINPIIAIKTTCFDTFSSMNVINRFHEEAKELKMKKQAELALKNESSGRITSSANKLNDIHKDKVKAIVASFELKDGLRTDIVTTATKMFGSGYVVKPKLSAWDPRNFARKNFVLQICSQDGRDVLGTITKSKSDNNLSLHFTDIASADDQFRLAVGFAKMIQHITHAVESAAPQTRTLDISDAAIKVKLDISDCPYATAQVIQDNVRDLKNSAIEIVDQKQNIRTATPTSEDTESKESKVVDPAMQESAQVEPHVELADEDDISEGDTDERSKSSSRSRRGGLPSGFVDDHNKL